MRSSAFGFAVMIAMATIATLAGGCSGCGRDDVGENPGLDGGPPPTNSGCEYPVPDDCTEVTESSPLPARVDRCYVLKKGGKPYVAGFVNVVDGGSLYIVEDPRAHIDLRVKSMLVEYGGTVSIGSPSCPFGGAGGSVSIGLYGDDPTKEGTVSLESLDSVEKGIECETGKGTEHACFPWSGEHGSGKHYCPSDATKLATKDTCNLITPPLGDDVNGRGGENFLVEHYGKLNFEPTSFGYKTLSVTYGGSLRMFGAKGAKSAPTREPEHCATPANDKLTLDAAEMKAWAKLTGSSWTRLDGQKDEGANSVLTLDRRVDDWTVGDELVVGPTDWYPGHHETRRIDAVDHGNADGKTRLTVAKLSFPHATTIFDTDSFGADAFTNKVNRKAVDLRAPVGLLSRSIQVRSLGKTATDDFPTADRCTHDKKSPDCYFGGHVMFRQGFKEVQIQAAEFKQLGQGGRIGHYPVHFHLTKSTKYTGDKAFVRDSSVWDSMTRFIVLHGSHDVKLSRNVGYLSVGHGYYGEDASEIDNQFCHNVGIGARAALKEYYVAQADPKSWPTGAKGEKTAPATARYIPGILDGVTTAVEPGAPATKRTGSDSFMPTMFWVMNAYNEMVGNLASGVHGFGSCYWLIGSVLSGPSRSEHSFGGLAVYNNGGGHAPLLRFRANGCSSSMLALSSQIDINPASGEDVGFTEAPNPYITKPDGTKKSPPELAKQFDRPIVNGNFRPIRPGAAAKDCVDWQALGVTALKGNADACAMTLIDRFYTSFNWTEVNFGSIWLRPGFYTFANGALTDQLFGGLTFVTGGSWVQTPPGYFSVAKNSLFVGVSQHGGSEWAQRSGPMLVVKKGQSTSPYEPCNGPKITCNLPEQGTGYFRDNFNPKRLLNIYDGPAYADGNTFVNVGAWKCDPQPCSGMSSDECYAALACVPHQKGNADCDKLIPCGVYSSTIEPSPFDPAAPLKIPDHFHDMVIPDAAIGWKQPNGFYYPPAFAHRNAAFLKKPPKLGTEAAGEPNGLNQCFSIGTEPGDTLARMRPGDCRHNVVDRTRNYIRGNLIDLRSNPQILRADQSVDKDLRLQVNPIDFQTILLDLDGSITGATSTLNGVSRPQPTASLSRNSFFDAPKQSEECLSFGVQTSPYQLVTTLVAQLEGEPKVGSPTYIDVADLPWQHPMVPIYRQFLFAGERAEDCGPVCNPAGTGLTYGCRRASFMMGPDAYAAPHLTMALPSGGSASAGAYYYIDTTGGGPSSAPTQTIECVTKRSQKVLDPMGTVIGLGHQLAKFSKGKSYLVYNLFARNDSKITYSFWTGATSLAALAPRFVRVEPHQPKSHFAQSEVKLECDPTTGTGWCAGTLVTLTDGVLTVTLDHSKIKESFQTSKRKDYESCMPRDFCSFDAASKRCKSCATTPGSCLPAVAGDVSKRLRAADLASMGTAAIDSICEQWSTLASGTVDNEPGELSLTDCPDGGCLGFTFTLTPEFTEAKPYAEVAKKLPCFEQTEWDKNALVARTSGAALADPLCGAPAAPQYSTCPAMCTNATAASQCVKF